MNEFTEQLWANLEVPRTGHRGKLLVYLKNIPPSVLLTVKTEARDDSRSRSQIMRKWNDDLRYKYNGIGVAQSV
jgi:hypothetical protein